jgi:tetratricopeptide (TPR) repeat protein
MAARIRRPGRPRGADFTSPLTIPGGEVAGVEIVRELAPDVALPAWQTLRSVLMWAAEEPGQRSDLFEPCAMAEWERDLLEGEWDPDLRLPLAVAVGELSRGSQAASDTLAHACLCVADWALERNAVATSMGFAEAAALCWPQSPRYAWMAGRLVRAHGRVQEAEHWFKRAARISTKTDDWDTHALALNSLGNTFAMQGHYQQAARSQTQALESARKHRLPERVAEALHDLCVATAHLGKLDQAEEHAREALEFYCTGHPRLLALAHDFAVIWMERGDFNRALPVLRALAEHFSDPAERMLVLSSAARAAGACAEEELYDQLAREVSQIEERHPQTRTLARSLFYVGLGGWSLNDWGRAEALLARAEQVARSRGEADVTVEAEDAVLAVRQRQPGRMAPLAAERARQGITGTLAGRFVAKLQKIRGSLEDWR